MINRTLKNAQPAESKGLLWVFIALLLIALTACGEVDDDDGDERDEVALPTDDTIPLDLYCKDIGLLGENCVLDDPANPYARSIVTEDSKFELDADAPSATAKFYLWATALARGAGNPGENQFYVGLYLHQMWASSNSELTRLQALRAYRAYLDNFFDTILFFEIPVDSENFVPQDVNTFVGQMLFDPTDVTNTFTSTRLFSPDPATNVFEASIEIGEWGYFFDEDTETFTRQP